MTGCLIAGPILMGELKESILSNIAAINGFGFDSCLKTVMLLKNMKAFGPKEVSTLATLFENCILGSLTPNEDYLKINKHYHEMQKIAENLQKYKKENKAAAYPYEIEAKLLQSVKNGDVADSLAVFRAFLGEVSVIEAGDLSSIRIKILNLCSVLLRLSAEKAGLSREETEPYYAYMDAVGEADSISELSAQASNFIEQAARAFRHGAYSGNSQIIAKAVSYILESYKDRISLKDIASTLHTSPSYLSMLFKQEMGFTITDYLNQVRIGRSRELLSEGNLSLLDIAVQSGFEDQSYFSKVFKKINGVTPKEYRKASL
ncbi:MAG: AraC family transcriptional regulator [Clostridiales bacterium]|nr:AraC family transcriptional regulator [Clostridiales bacterium]